MTNAQDYSTLAPLSEIYLEDSYVLDIVARIGEVRFELEAVLREGHPEYREPGPDEQYCYRRGALRFGNARRVDWRHGITRPSVDAEGEEDYGNIDSFLVDGGSFELEGDWGSMHVESDPPTFELHPR